MSIQKSITKICGKCKIEKSIQEFHKRKNSKDSHCNQCKSCKKFSNKSYRKLNRKEILESKKKYYLINKEKIAKYKKEYYKTNKEKIKKSARDWNKSNKEKVKTKNKAYRENNKEKIKNIKKAYMKKRRNTDSLFKFIQNIRHRITTSLKNGGYSKNSHTYEILGKEYEFVWNYLLKKAKKRYPNFSPNDFLKCNKYHLDHIIPISLGKNKKEIIQLNYYTNFQILLAKENLTKSNSMPNDFISE